MEAAWFNTLLAVVAWTQHALLRALYVLGLTGDTHGQPAWPWAHRIAAETLRIDLGLARELAWSLAALGVSGVLLAAAVAWRRRRAVLIGLALLVMAVAPWRSPAVLLAPAVPTSFHASATGFSVESIALGAKVYAGHCAACHGVDGRGEGPRAGLLRRWPPTVVGPLLGRRPDGELFWRVLHGMRHGEDGDITMPGFGRLLSDTEAWAVLDYMKALAAGTGAMDGAWPLPVALPEVMVRCAGSAPRPLSQWRGQARVRVVALDGGDAPREDPRFQTLLVTPDGASPPAAPFRAACVADSPAAWAIFAGLSGQPPGRFAGTQLLADRAGWLRARTAAAGGWNDADLLCAALPGRRNVAEGDGLPGLLQRMEAEPVRFIKGGFIHAMGQ